MGGCGQLGGGQHQGQEQRPKSRQDAKPVGEQTERRADGRADRTQSWWESRQDAVPRRPKTDKTQSHRGRRQTGRRATEAEDRQDAEPQRPNLEILETLSLSVRASIIFLVVSSSSSFTTDMSSSSGWMHELFVSLSLLPFRPSWANGTSRLLKSAIPSIRPFSIVRIVNVVIVAILLLRLLTVSPLKDAESIVTSHYTCC